MKRLRLEDFKTQKTTQTNPEQPDLLLAQVLGDCHDKPDDNCSDDTSTTNDDEGGSFWDIVGLAIRAATP